MADSPLLAPEERVLPTLNDDGTRRWINPKHATGRYNTMRQVVGWGLIVIFVALPFIKMGGRPSIWLNLPAREFTFFGRVFLPTDTEVLLLGMLAIFVGVFLLTALVGRAWCGYGCPQTVYMELVYRPIERRFQRFVKGYEKTWRKPFAVVAKQAVFLLISLGLAHTFLSYFVSVDELARWVRMSPLQNPAVFLIMVATTGLIWFDFGYFREQMCTVVCPYARLQTVLLDKHSLIIGYDHKRGEARGKGAAKEMKKRLPLVERQFGDCIDCNACVSVCPTGIDIRDGLQLECIACAQCADACDAIMDKMGQPRGLVRYSSQENLDEGGETKLIRGRTIAYPAILTVLVGLLAFVLMSSEVGEVKLLRGVGAPFTVQDDGMVANQIRVRVANRGEATQDFTIALADGTGFELIAPQNPMTIDANDTKSAPIFVRAPKEAFATGDVTVNVVVTTADGWRKELPFNLLGPRGGTK